jgi:hypothetical protein
MPSLKAADACDNPVVHRLLTEFFSGSAGGDAEAVVVHTRNGWSQAERDR